MSAKILYGKPVSKQIKNELQPRINILNEKGIIPKLSAILIGNDPASRIYVNTKHKTFLKFGCSSEIHVMSENSKEEEVYNLIKKLNEDDNVHGILLQLPLPDHLNSRNLLDFISPEKDVDGFHPENLGNLLKGHAKFIPCTPFGCLKILEYYNIDVNSKHVVIVGRSNIVGKPLMALLCQKFDFGNATVTICHTGTHDISHFTKQADILIAAIGSPEFIKEDMVKDDVVILDVGINRINDESEKGYYLVGDVNFKHLIHKASAITPVPGGVGPMTISMLLNNTIMAAELQS